MRILQHLFERNRAWADEIRRNQPDFFETLSRQQKPEYLWIGCSDSRIPAEQIVGLLPGELFVHRNVANVVSVSDLNCLSVVQFAIDILKVRHVIVCGHYGCGGVRAALNGDRVGLVENWLQHVHGIHRKYRDELNALGDADAQCDRLCELNVVEQVYNLCRTPAVRDAWARDQFLSVHGWIYSLSDGLLRDLGLTMDGPDTVDACYSRVITSLLHKERP